MTYVKTFCRYWLYHTIFECFSEDPTRPFSINFFFHQGLLQEFYLEFKGLFLEVFFLQISFLSVNFPKLSLQIHQRRPPGNLHKILHEYPTESSRHVFVHYIFFLDFFIRWLFEEFIRNSVIFLVFLKRRLWKSLLEITSRIPSSFFSMDFT